MYAPPPPRGCRLLVGFLLFGALPARAEDPVPVARPVSPPGSLLHRQGGEWHSLKAGEEIRAGDLLVALPGAALESRGGVRLALVSDLFDQSPYPVREGAVTLHATEGFDLDFTFDRGRVDLINQKKSGPARVRVRGRDRVGELTLREPGARVALELYGRWDKGVCFSKDPECKDAPTQHLIILVLKGQLDVRTDRTQFALHAPPGPAYFSANSVDGPDSGPTRLEKLPPWADAESGTTEEARQRRQTVARIRERLATRPVKQALAEAVASGDPRLERGAVYGLGALDYLPELLDALDSATSANLRETAILALRHWIGRATGQDLKVYKALQEHKKYTPRQAEIVMHLLHSFSDQDLGKPETYELLIEYLKSPQLPVRELARWHLYRLAEPGKDIPYDPAGPQDQRDRAYAAWQKLLKDGKLPPARDE